MPKLRQGWAATQAGQVGPEDGQDGAEDGQFVAHEKNASKYKSVATAPIEALCN